MAGLCGNYRYARSHNRAARRARRSNPFGASAGKEAFFTGPYARHVIAGVGHFIQRERPDAVVEAVLQLARSKNKLR